MRIGIFDSGIGGLTVLSAMIDHLDGHEMIYLGDTARIPYGTRSPHTVIRYSLRVASYLWRQRVDAIVIACNTASTHALSLLQEAAGGVGIPVIGVIEPGVQAALAVHTSGAIAVLGTPGTIHGGAYQRRLAELAPDTEVIAKACPLFVPLVEEGWTAGAVPHLVARAYLEPLKGRVKTVILGCTHYPLLKAVIAQELPGATLVDSAIATATMLETSLGMGKTEDGSVIFKVTDNIERFCTTGARVLGYRPNPVEWVDLHDPDGPFAAYDKDLT